MLNYSLYQAAIKEIRKSGYILDENDINEMGKKVKDKREIFEFAQKVISKVHRVVEEETYQAHTTALNVLKRPALISRICTPVDFQQLRHFLLEQSAFYAIIPKLVRYRFSILRQHMVGRSENVFIQRNTFYNAAAIPDAYCQTSLGSNILCGIAFQCGAIAFSIHREA